MPTKLTGHVISHTHWDRAWYWTFEQTRVRLLDLMDDLLDLMQRQPDYRHFVLDGQLAMVEDYLALRPERTEQVRTLSAEGRLLLGPFYVLPDLFIPCGESLVRNLRMGHDAAAPLGPVMKSGYVPDPFGHPAQLPQILCGFGIHDMSFSRGMGDESRRLDSDFYWEAPDGSQVLATHQIGGYCNLERFGRPQVASARDDTPRLPPEQELACALEQIQGHLERMAPKSPSGQLMLGNGCDHLPAQAELPELLEAVNERLPGLRLVHSTPPAFHRAVRRAIRRGAVQPRTFRGELRGGRFANLLPGVLSARVDLKLEHDRCERLLLRWAEPFAALASSLGRGRDRRALLQHAWRELLLCQPHDDICGCSIDRVHEDDLGRMARVQEVAQCVRDGALEALGAGLARPTSAGWAAFNPNPWPVRALVPLDGSRARGVVHDNGPAPMQRIKGGRLAQVELPALGCCRLEPGPLAGELAGPAVQASQGDGQVVLDNGLLRLSVRLDRGQIRLRHRESGLTFTELCRLVDEGDAGDTYDFSPPRRQSTVRGPQSFRQPRLLERGPLRARLLLRGALALPLGLDRVRRGRSSRQRQLPVELVITMTQGSPRLELSLSLTNTVIDHRLRLTLRAPFATDKLICGAPFQVLRRPISPPAHPDWQQPPQPHQPFADFVALEQPRQGGIALLAPGLREAEGRRAGQRTELGVTLLRSVGWLSRDDLQTRRDEAGPQFQVQGALHREQTLRFRLALLPYSGSWHKAAVPRHYAELAAPPQVVALAQSRPPQPELPSSLGFLELHPATVQLVALVPREQGRLEARLVNLGPRAVKARIDGPYSARLMRIDGSVRRGQIDLAAVPMRPGEIVTLELRRRP